MSALGYKAKVNSSFMCSFIFFIFRYPSEGPISVASTQLNTVPTSQGTSDVMYSTTWWVHRSRLFILLAYSMEFDKTRRSCNNPIHTCFEMIASNDEIVTKTVHVIVVAIQFCIKATKLCHGQFLSDQTILFIHTRCMKNIQFCFMEDIIQWWPMGKYILKHK